jgi:hypothetical protein
LPTAVALRPALVGPNPGCGLLARPTATGRPSRRDTRARAVTAPSADGVAQPVGVGWWLPWGEITRTSTGEVRATRWASIGEWGLIEALWRW